MNDVEKWIYLTQDAPQICLGVLDDVITGVIEASRQKELLKYSDSYAHNSVLMSAGHSYRFATNCHDPNLNPYNFVD